MNFGSLFAGIGGLDLGLERAGMTCKWQVEIDDYATRVLAKHWPTVPRYRDVREVGKHNLEPVDLICGGFPCQDVSQAKANAEGLAGKRSGLWSEYIRIVRELRPSFVLVENVPALLDRGMGDVLRDLAACRYDAEWSVFPACALGAPHTRERVFILAYADSVLLDWSVPQTEFPDKSWQETPMGQSVRMGSPKVWREAIRTFRGDDDGFSAGLDRIRTLGNAVVPQVAEWIGKRIMQTI